MDLHNILEKIKIIIICTKEINGRTGDWKEHLVSDSTEWITTGSKIAQALKYFTLLHNKGKHRFEYLALSDYRSYRWLEETS
jgi:hypothetical protein